ncbi:hypothetical protein CR513_28421, partial [Mucuna pruriens]
MLGWVTRFRSPKLTNQGPKIWVIIYNDRPNNVVRSFHGLASFYRNFVKDFSTLAPPLNEIITKKYGFLVRGASRESFPSVEGKTYRSPNSCIAKLFKIF